MEVKCKCFDCEHFVEENKYCKEIGGDCNYLDCDDCVWDQDCDDFKPKKECCCECKCLVYEEGKEYLFVLFHDKSYGVYEKEDVVSMVLDGEVDKVFEIGREVDKVFEIGREVELQFNFV